jgi:hypothetical protein
MLSTKAKAKAKAEAEATAKAQPAERATLLKPDGRLATEAAAAVAHHGAEG